MFMRKKCTSFYFILICIIKLEYGTGTHTNYQNMMGEYQNLNP